MTPKVLQLASFAFILCFSTMATAQTTGTLTFSYNQPVPTAPKPTYSGFCVTAVWIEDNAGTFIKTKMRYVGNGTQDHLPTFAVKAGGVASNALGAVVNVTDATTGATRKNTTVPVGFGAQSFVWDGKNVNGAANGVTVADGIYKVWIESTWVDSGSNNHQELSSYAFTKGPTSATTTAVGDAYVNTIVMKWAATGLGVKENVSPNTQVVVYPNPTNGIFNIDFKNEINNIKVSNMVGQVLYDEKVAVSALGTTKNIDLSSFENGTYIINVTNDKGSSSYKVVLDK
ncbi:MAG: T9SS type A sorting domain-containing protein [Flavobacterium sp.]|nr:T9SS type A sorting domain-containing protein [Flavobacterium sp.]